MPPASKIATGQCWGSSADRGTKVVRHGRDDPAALIEAFAEVGLEILGPSEAQLVACAEAISSATDDAAARVDSLVAKSDTFDETQAYRDLVREPVVDAATDALSRPGPAINLQSIVTSFQVR